MLSTILNSSVGRVVAKKEIIQIAAIKIDEVFNEVATFDVYVKRTLNPKLSDYIIEFTGISYGGDHIIMQENCDLVGIDWTCGAHHFDILPLYQQAGIDTSSYNSGALYKAVGLNLEEQEHNALFDVFSLIETAKHLSNRGMLKLM